MKEKIEIDSWLQYVGNNIPSLKNGTIYRVDNMSDNWFEILVESEVILRLDLKKNSKEFKVINDKELEESMFKQLEIFKKEQ
jgi:hypothetical protein